MKQWEIHIVYALHHMVFTCCLSFIHSDRQAGSEKIIKWGGGRLSNCN
jgi:hypothetical protein